MQENNELKCKMDQGSEIIRERRLGGQVDEV